MPTQFNKVKDNAYSTLASGISSSATSFSYATGEGSRFPSPPYKVVIGGINGEIVKVTAQSGDNVTTCLRGQDGTTAQAWDAGTLVELMVIAPLITELQDAVNAVEGQFDPSTGHDHDGTDSKKVLATNLDPTGLTASQLLRVNSGGTAVESSGKTAPSGDIVGTTDTQTLTNKTLTKPTIQGSVPNVRSYSPGAGTTCTLDLSDANVHVIQMPAGNITIALSNVSVGQIFSIEIIQDSTGGRTVTWFSTIRWVSGSAPTLSTGGNKKDCFVFRCASSGNYDGYVAGQNI